MLHKSRTSEAELRTIKSTQVCGHGFGSVVVFGEQRLKLGKCRWNVCILTKVFFRW